MLNKFNKIYNIDKTLYPAVFSLIKALPEKYIYFKSYQNLRHPGSILTRATEEIVRSMNNVLAQYNNILLHQDENGKISDNTEMREFLDELQNLIGHFDSFQDECYLLLKGLCPPPTIDNAATEKFTHEWLKKNKFLCANNFFGYTGNIQKYIDLFSNRLKHANQRFDFVTAAAEGNRINGVYIEELRGSDVKEVYPWIPSRMEQAAVAFSINYLLKALLLCFYELSEALEKTINVHIKTTYNDTVKNIHQQKHNDSFEDMVLEVSELPNTFYPYEYIKQPKISMKGNEIKISYPHGDKIPYHSTLKATAMFVADGYTNEFHLPFFG